MRLHVLWFLGAVLLLSAAQWPFFDDVNDAHVPPPNQDPVASSTQTPAWGESPLEVEFDANDAHVPPPNQDPAASFAQTPTWGESPLEVEFDASASTDPDGWIVSYAWDFGDGTSAVGKSAANTYTTSTAHTFTAWLTVTDNAGGTDTTSRFITVAGTIP